MVLESGQAPRGDRKYSSDAGSVGERSLPHEERLPKRERITEEHEYKSVIKNGRLIRTQTFKAYFLSGKGLRRRAGFVAGKRVGGAHERNRARRLLKEAYRGLKARLEPVGFNVVFVAQRATAEADKNRIQDEMEGMFDRCGVALKQ
jgi:ribonuclease P protein component